MRNKTIIAILTVLILILPTSTALSTPVEDLASRIEKEAKYSHGDYSTYRPMDWPLEFNLALSAMNYTSQNISPLIYGYNYVTSGKSNYSVDEAIKEGAGLCGTQVAVFAELMKELGIPLRTIQLYQIDRPNGSNHIFAEVFYLNQWHMFDITYAAFFRKEEARPYEVMSFQEILNCNNYMDYAVINQSCLLNQRSQINGNNVLDYIESPNKDIIISGSGTINLTPYIEQGRYAYSMANVPNYVGRNIFSYTNQVAEMKYHLKICREPGSWC